MVNTMQYVVGIYYDGHVEITETKEKIKEGE
jgi:hypothetical protein